MRYWCTVGRACGGVAFCFSFFFLLFDCWCQPNTHNTQQITHKKKFARGSRLLGSFRIPPPIRCVTAAVTVCLAAATLAVEV